MKYPQGWKMDRSALPGGLVDVLAEWLDEDRKAQHARTIGNVCAIIEDEGTSSPECAALLARIIERATALEAQRP